MPFLRAWYLHGALWLLDGFSESAPRLAERGDSPRVRAIVQLLQDQHGASSLIRVGAWTIAANCLRSAGDAAMHEAFREDFHAITSAEKRLADYASGGDADSEIARLARISLESLVLTSGAEPPAGGYKDNPGLLMYWAETSSNCMITAKRFVDDVIDQLGEDAAQRVLRHCPPD